MWGVAGLVLLMTINIQYQSSGVIAGLLVQLFWGETLVSAMGIELGTPQRDTVGSVSMFTF